MATAIRKKAFYQKSAPAYRPVPKNLSTSQRVAAERAARPKSWSKPPRPLPPSMDRPRPTHWSTQPVHIPVQFVPKNLITIMGYCSMWARDLKETTPFFRGQYFCTKFDPLNDFLKPRASYHFKVQLLTKLSFKSSFKLSFKLGVLKFKNY